MLYTLAISSHKMIKSPSFDEIPLEILRNTKHYSWVKDYIGAVDGMHMPVVVPTTQATPYRSGRKNKYTQNEMAISSFDMHFT